MQNRNQTKSLGLASALLGGGLVLAGLLITAPGAPTKAAMPPADSLQITGAGATFPYPMYSKWFNEYQKLHPNIEINYQSIGSGGGIKQVTEGTVDFGASDGPMTDDQLNAFQAKHGAPVLHFPTVLGADVPTYNIPGVKAELKFTPEALAGIFLGKITKWNDPAITGQNSGVELPGADIVVVHRSDGSGTTYIWTDYLSKVSEEWKNKVGKGTSVNWPVGLGGKGNEGVSGQVQQTANSIGYVELIYAIQNHMSYGMVKNAAGNFVKADLASVTEAASGASRDMPDDFRVSITNAQGKNAYPVSSFTWLQAITDFLHWMMTDGQNMTEALAYARLPRPVQQKELKSISKVQ
ncbi:MAG: phosphate ABC transporter substrate-binding protein PstS [Acidobacteria bacterium]|nr:MAG: phosphate ABC transporter substrate-binding protein PstS [Acidobacteriota bacterium]